MNFYGSFHPMCVVELNMLGGDEYLTIDDDPRLMFRASSFNDYQRWSSSTIRVPCAEKGRERKRIWTMRLRKHVHDIRRADWESWGSGLVWDCRLT